MAEYHYKTEAIYRLLIKVRDIDAIEKKSEDAVEKRKKELRKIKLAKKKSRITKGQATKDDTGMWTMKLGYAAKVKEYHRSKKDTHRKVKVHHYYDIWKKYFDDSKGDEAIPEFIKDQEAPWDILCEIFLEKEKIYNMAGWCKSLGLESKMVYKKDWIIEPAKNLDKKLEGCYEGFFLRTQAIFINKPWHIGKCWMKIEENKIYLKSTAWATATGRNNMISKHEWGKPGFLEITFHSEADQTKFPFQFNFSFEKQVMTIDNVEKNYLVCSGTYSGYYPREEKFIPVSSSIMMRKLDKEEALYQIIENSFSDPNTIIKLEEKHDYTGIQKVHEFANKYPEFFKFLKENNSSGTAAFTGKETEEELRTLKKRLQGDYSLVLPSATFMKIRRLVMRVYPTGFCLIKGFKDSTGTISPNASEEEKNSLKKDEEYVYEGKVFQHESSDQININTYKRYQYTDDLKKENKNDFEKKLPEEEQCSYCYSFNTRFRHEYRKEVFEGLRIGVERDSNSASACRFKLYKEDDGFFDENGYEEVLILPYKNIENLNIPDKDDVDFKINDFSKINVSKKIKISDENVASYYGDSDKIIIIRNEDPKKESGFVENEDYKINYFYASLCYYLLNEGPHDASFIRYFKRAIIHGLSKEEVLFQTEKFEQLINKKYRDKNFNVDNLFQYFKDLQVHKMIDSSNVHTRGFIFFK